MLGRAGLQIGTLAEAARGAASSSEFGFAGCSLFCKRARSARHVGAQMLSIDVVVARTDLLRIGSVLSETYYETLVSIGARFLEVR